nr:hypothetical protein [Tanacetum cinerariifolium]
MVFAGRSLFLLVVIILAGYFVPAGSYGLCWWLRVHAGRHTSAGGFISTGGCVFLLFSRFLLIVDSFCWLDTFMLLALFMLNLFLLVLREDSADDGLDLWRDVNMLCRSLHADDVEEFWRDQDDWIVSSWTLYTKSTVHVMDLTNGNTVYMFMGSLYPIQATLLERMLRHMLTVPLSYYRHVRVGGIVVDTIAGTIIRTVQADLLQATMPVSSAPMKKGCEDFPDILNYMGQSLLRYALTHDPPVVFDSLVKQFWATAVVRPNEAGPHDLVATIDGHEVVVTESLIRTQLQLADANGIFDMPINDIFEGMMVIGYPTHNVSRKISEVLVIKYS